MKKVYTTLELGLTIEEQFKSADWRLIAIERCWKYINVDFTYFLASSEDALSLPDDVNTILLRHFSQRGKLINEPFLVTMDQLEFIVKTYNIVSSDLKGQVIQEEKQKFVVDLKGHVIGDPK